MAIIECPECGAQISDRAGNCPACGYPIASQVRRRGWDNDVQVVTIQRTRKRYKLMSLAGSVLMILGAFAMMGGAGSGMFTAGIMIALLTRILIWWHHD